MGHGRTCRNAETDDEQGIFHRWARSPITRMDGSRLTRGKKSRTGSSRKFLAFHENRSRFVSYMSVTMTVAIHDLAQHRLPRFGGGSGVAVHENWSANNAANDEPNNAGRSPPPFLRTTTTSPRFLSSPQCPPMSGSHAALRINFADSRAILNIFDTKAIVISTRQHPTIYPRTPLPDSY